MRPDNAAFTAEVIGRLCWSIKGVWVRRIFLGQPANRCPMGCRPPIIAWARTRAVPAHVATAKSVLWPAAGRQLRHSSDVKRVKASRMAAQRSGTVRVAAVRNRAFSLAKICSIGLKSGL